MSLVAVVTTTVSRVASPSLVPVYFHIEPASKGNHVLSTRGIAGKLAASNAAGLTDEVGAVGVGCVAVAWEPPELHAASAIGRANRGTMNIWRPRMSSPWVRRAWTRPL